jgi:anti-sigma B factor antagonist
MRAGETVQSDVFGIEDRNEGSRHTLLLRGELDIASAPSLEGMFQELCQGGARELVLDLSQLAFMDSTGLNAILRCRKLSGEHDCKLGLVPGPRSVQRVFELTHVLDRLPFRDPGEAQPAWPQAS